jgi:hypothetical protein
MVKEIKQSYYQYVFSRVEFALAVGLFVEFGFETRLRSDFDVTDDWEDMKSQILTIKPTKDVPDPKMYDLCFECMQFAKEFRMSPQNIAERLKPYLDFNFISEVTVIGGYINIFLDRIDFLHNV